MATEFRLCDEDREKFGGPEWVAFDIAHLDDMPLDEIDVLEKQIIDRAGVSMVVLIAREFANGTLIGQTCVLWLARQLAGITEPSLAEFNIKPRRIKMRAVKPSGDVDPPAPASSSTSSVEEPSAKP